MNKKEFTTLIRNLAFHFGERVSCEWLSPDGVEWLKWKNAEISVQFLIDLEKGYIRNIQIPQASVKSDMSKERLQEIAKELANNAKMPYCWEDVYNRLIGGYQLPFRVKVE